MPRKNLKEEILQKLLITVRTQEPVNRKVPIVFSSRDLSDDMDEYVVSVRRELRTLRQMKVINYKVIDRLKGTYKLTLPEVKDKYTKQNLIEMLIAGIEKVRTKERPSHSLDVHKWLTNAANRNFSKARHTEEKSG